MTGQSIQIQAKDTFLPYRHSPMPTREVPPPLVGEPAVRVVDMDKLFSTILRSANEQFPPADIIRYSGFHPPDSVPPGLWEKKLSRLRWSYSSPPEHELTLNTPTSMQYIKTFRDLDPGTLARLRKEAQSAVGKTTVVPEYQGKKGHLIYYYLARPPVITIDMVTNFLTDKYGLTPTERKHIFGLKIVPARTVNRYDSFLVWNISPENLWDITVWLQSPELMYRPGGSGFTQTMHRLYAAAGLPIPGRLQIAYQSFA